MNLPTLLSDGTERRRCADPDVLSHDSTLSPRPPHSKGTLPHSEMYTQSFHQWSECAPGERKNPPSQVRGNIFRGKLLFISLPALLKVSLRIFLILTVAWKISWLHSSELELRLQRGSIQIPKLSSAREFPVGHI